MPIARTTTLPTTVGNSIVRTTTLPTTDGNLIVRHVTLPLIVGNQIVRATTLPTTVGNPIARHSTLLTTVGNQIARHATLLTTVGNQNIRKEPPSKNELTLSLYPLSSHFKGTVSHVFLHFNRILLIPSNALKSERIVSLYRMKGRTEILYSLN